MENCIIHERLELAKGHRDQLLAYLLTSRNVSGLKLRRIVHKESSRRQPALAQCGIGNEEV